MKKIISSKVLPFFLNLLGWNFCVCSSLSWCCFLKRFQFLVVQNHFYHSSQDPWLGLCNSITWLDLELLSKPNTSTVSKIRLKKITYVACCSARSSPVCAKTWFQQCFFSTMQFKKTGICLGLEWWKWSFELLPSAKGLCHSICPHFVPKGLAGRSHAIVDYPHFSMRKMEGLGVNHLVRWLIFLPRNLYAFFYSITCCYALVKMLIIISIVISTNFLKIQMHVTLKCVASSSFACLMGCWGSF